VDVRSDRLQWHELRNGLEDLASVIDLETLAYHPTSQETG
jgi:hypothetical protein